MGIKNILYVSHFNGDMTGAETGLFNIIKYLDRHKYKPLVLCRSQGIFTERLEGLGVEVVYLDFPVLQVQNNEYNLQAFRNFIRGTIENTEDLLKIINAKEIDLIHTNVSVVLIGALAARLKGIPHIWHVKEILGPGLWSRLFSIFIPFFSSKVIAVSQASGKIFNIKKCKVIYDGIDLASFSIEESNHLLDQGAQTREFLPTLGFIGSIIGWKGVHTFLMAAVEINKILPKAQFLIAGDLIPSPEYSQKLEEFVQLAGLETKVKFIGFQEDIPKILSTLDIVVVPSRRPDPLPNVVLESMASGKVVVASSSGGIPEVIIHGKTGFLFPPGDYNALAKILISLLEDNKLRQAVGFAARKLVDERFSAKAMSEKVQYLYEDTLKLSKNNGNLYRPKIPCWYRIFFDVFLQFFQAYLFFFKIKRSLSVNLLHRGKKDIWMTDQMLDDECLSFCNLMNRAIEKKRRKNILMLTPELPYPLNKGGNVKIYNHLKMLSAEYNIYLLSFIGNDEERKYIPRLEEFCKKVNVVLLGYDSKFFFKNISLPQVIRCLYSEEFKSILMKIIDSEKIDLVQIDSIFMALYVDYLGNTPSILIEHDADISSFRRTYIWNIRGNNFLFRFVETSKLSILKMKTYKKFNKVITLSKRDKGEIERLTGIPDIAVVPPGVDLDFLSFNCNKNDVAINNIAFVGHMKHYPNEDGILYFYNQIFPLIKKELADIKLYIIGSYPTKNVLGLSKDKNIVVKGSLEDIRPYLRNCSLLVVPIRLGGGVRMKILEAMAMGIPVISTSVGCNGIDLTEGKDIIIADRPEEFAKQVVRLLQDENLRRSLSKNGRRLIEEKYSLERTASQLNEVYQEVLNGNG